MLSLNSTPNLSLNVYYTKRELSSFILTQFFYTFILLQTLRRFTATEILK